MPHCPDLRCWIPNVVWNPVVIAKLHILAGTQAQGKTQWQGMACNCDLLLWAAMLIH